MKARDREAQMQKLQAMKDALQLLTAQVLHDLSPDDAQTPELKAA
ncbi:MAG: hypothetical protein ACI9VR_005236 [Cognaticolwellia sp.]|jgi:hypothetical protein